MEYAEHTVALDWARSTVANIQFAPLIAVYDAVEIASRNPRSLLRTRYELEHTQSRTWQAIKCARIARLACEALTNLDGNLAARAYAGLSKQGTASHLSAILTWPERKVLKELLQLLHSAARVRPLGERIPGACARVATSRAKGRLAEMMKRANAADVFTACDHWLGSDASLVQTSVFERVLCGHRETLETLQLARAYAVGDYRWRFLFGYLVGEQR